MSRYYIDGYLMTALIHLLLNTFGTHHVLPCLLVRKQGELTKYNLLKTLVWNQVRYEKLSVLIALYKRVKMGLCRSDVF